MGLSRQEYWSGLPLSPKPFSSCKPSSGLPVTALLTSWSLFLRLPLLQASPSLFSHLPFFKVLQTPMGTISANTKHVHLENFPLLESTTRCTVASGFSQLPDTVLQKLPNFAKNNKKEDTSLGLSWQPISCVGSLVPSQMKHSSQTIVSCFEIISF